MGTILLGDRKITTPAVCASIAGSDEGEILSGLRSAKKLGADLAEIRLDLARRKPSLERILTAEIPVIVTNRSRREGGCHAGSEEERVGLLADSLDLDPLCIDIELSTAPILRRNLMLKARRKGVPVMISHHRFSDTPEPELLRGVLDEIAGEGCDLAKIVTMARSKEDAFRMLEFMVRIQGNSKLPVISFAMGRRGSVTRYIALALGSPWMYAGVFRRTAQGQPDLKTAVSWARELRRLEVK